MIERPLRATWRRWWRFARSPYTIYRTFEYELIEGLLVHGRVLDIGGGQVNSYYHLLKADGHIESVNISQDIEPTLIADLNQPLPVDDGIYDTVLCFNTLEHVTRDELALAELVRVLRPGGTFHIVVPWVYRIHGSPYDYHRHTDQWWTDQLLSLGVQPSDLVVEPMVWDPIVTAFSLVESARGGRWFRLLRPLVMLPSVLVEWRAGGLRKSASLAAQYRDFPLGYYITGTK